MKVLLVNPPIYDFTAYDFWLKPYGMLRVASLIKAKKYLFDFIDRAVFKRDRYGRGKILSKKTEKPKEFKNIKRYFKRFGSDRREFVEYLKKIDPDFVLISTGMTYWYLGVKEVINAVREYSRAKIILGGIYATLLKEHAYSLGADLVVGKDINVLAEFFDLKDLDNPLPEWSLYEKLSYGVLKLTEGCIYNCSYCASKVLYDNFRALDQDNAILQLENFYKHGIKDVVFYDDALLYNADKILIPFLENVEKRFNNYFRFHTPNALHARFLKEDLAEILVKSGFKTFYLGFENIKRDWIEKTGNKISKSEFEDAVNNLISAGAERSSITAYIMMGHPLQKIEDVYESMDFIKNLKIRFMLSEYSPVPKTKDFKIAMKVANLREDEPLYQNKTAYPIFLWGEEVVNDIKLRRKIILENTFNN